MPDHDNASRGCTESSPGPRQRVTQLSQNESQPAVSVAAAEARASRWLVPPAWTTRKSEAEQPA